jgi:hypothetical protein
VAVAYKMSVVSAGGSADLALHFTRQTELGRDGKEQAREPKDGGRQALLDFEDGPVFWTREMPAGVLREDAEVDRVAAHVFGWDADVGRAEERLALEQERGHLSTLEGGRYEFRTDEERAREALAPPRKSRADMSPQEREVVRCRAYFSMREAEESARRRRGAGKTVTGYGVIISFDEQVTNKEVRELVDRFLETPMEVVFRKGERPRQVPNPLRCLPAMFAIHDEGTEHKHCHAQFDCRDARGEKVKIRPQVWKSFDAHWARVYAVHRRDKKLYEEHARKKAETQEWKRSTRERAGKNLPPLPKPHRVADERDQRLLKVRSQIKTDLLTLGLDPAKFRIAERLKGLRSRDETRRLKASAELAEARLLHAVATSAGAGEVRALEGRAQALAGELRDALAAQEAAEKRRAGGEKKPEPFYRTTKQEAELKALTRDRIAAARDDRRAGLLAGQFDLAGARAAASAKELAEFAQNRNFVEIEVRLGESWTLSAVAQQTTSMCRPDGPQRGQRLLPGIGALSAGERLEELNRVKAQVESQVAALEERLRQRERADRWRAGLLGRALEEAKAERERVGRGAPAPLYTVEVYEELDGLAHRLRDSGLARRLHETGRSHRLSPERAQATAEVELGRELVARKELLLVELRYSHTLEVSRQAAGRAPADHAGESLHAEVKERERAYRSAVDYLMARQANVADCLTTLGVTREEVTPRFTAGELEGLREFVALMPRGRSRTEFERALGRVVRPPEKAPEAVKEVIKEVIKEPVREPRPVPPPERKPEPLSDRETAALHATVLVAKVRAVAWLTEAERFKLYSLFRHIEVKGQWGETLVWSVAQAKYELEKRDHWTIDKNQLAASVREAEKEIQLRGEALEARAASAAAGHERVLNEFVRAMDVRETHGLGMPGPELNPEQTKEIERLLAVTRNGQDLQLLVRAEAEQDLWAAAGRAEARGLLALFDLFEDKEKRDLGDRQAEKKLSSLPPDHPLAADLKRYLDYRQAEGAKMTSFALDAEKAARDLRAQCNERYGRQAPPLFLEEEVGPAREKLNCAGYHEKRFVVKEINVRGPQVLCGDGRIEPAKFVEGLGSNYEKYNEYDLAREFEHALTH